MTNRLGRARAEKLARQLFDAPNSRIRYYPRPRATEAVTVRDGDVIHLLVGEHVRPSAPERDSSAA